MRKTERLRSAFASFFDRLILPPALTLMKFVTGRRFERNTRNGQIVPVVISSRVSAETISARKSFAGTVDSGTRHRLIDQKRNFLFASIDNSNDR